MHARVRNLWELLLASYWFVPTLMLIGAFGLAVLTLYIDYHHFSAKSDLEWLYTGGAEGARVLLASLSGSVITVAGVAFSIIIVVMSLASNQFGPRLLRNFMRDRGNQIVLGVFTATFLYCLLILRTIRDQEGGVFVPHLSVTVALVLALVSLVVLIYFIHHVSALIQAPNVIATIGDELHENIERLFPVEVGRPPQDTQRADDASVADWRNSEPAARILAKKTGYLQALDDGEILKLADEHDLVLQLHCRPGDFIIANTVLMSVWPEERFDSGLRRRLRRAFVIGATRTPTQDVEFSVRQLVEIALRALSTGVNDTPTAIACVDWLGSGLYALARQEIPSRFRHHKGKLRVIAHTTNFGALCSAAFNQIRQSAATNVAVSIRILEVIATIGPHMAKEEQRLALLHHARMVHGTIIGNVTVESDREDIERRFESVVKSLSTGESAAETHLT